MCPPFFIGGGSFRAHTLVRPYDAVSVSYTHLDVYKRQGLMYGLYHGYPFADCVRFGNITGGKSVTGVGCLTEYVQESELLALREKYKDL